MRLGPHLSCVDREGRRARLVSRSICVRRLLVWRDMRPPKQCRPISHCRHGRAGHPARHTGGQATVWSRSARRAAIVEEKITTRSVHCSSAA
jgi:hypothetical protein